MDSPFRHPDPDRIHRLLRKWDSGFQLTLDDLRDFEQLSSEWIAYYERFGNHREARLLLTKTSRIRKAISCQKPVQTSRGVSYVKPRRKVRQTEL